ncbi:MAG: hypothetical protein ACYDER_01495 [Ktedonobacteraceae bacterium]
MREQVGFPYSHHQNKYHQASTHRAGYQSGIHPEDQPYTSEDLNDEDEYDDVVPVRTPRSAVRWTSTEAQTPVRPIKQRRVVVHQEPPPERYKTRTSRKQESEPLPQREKRHVHWLVFLGGGLLFMVLGWVLLSGFSSWWQIQEDNWHYGMPRTYQIDAVVGHHDSPTNPSHFVAMNLNGKVEVIEVQGGDPAHSIIYVGPTLLGQDAELAPVTLTFADINGDGKPDMEVHVLGETIIFLNDGTKFVAPKNL